MRKDGCTCDKCVDCCKHLPGIPYPEDIIKIGEFLQMPINELLRKYFVAGWRTGVFGDDETIRFVYPAMKGYAGYEEDWGYPLCRRPCVFLKKDRCSIHEAAPHECQTVFGCEKSTHKHSEPRNQALKIWQKAWKDKTLHSEIIRFIETAPQMDSWKKEKEMIKNGEINNIPWNE